MDEKVTEQGLDPGTSQPATLTVVQRQRLHLPSALTLYNSFIHGGPKSRPGSQNKVIRQPRSLPPMKELFKWCQVHCLHDKKWTGERRTEGGKKGRREGTGRVGRGGRNIRKGMTARKKDWFLLTSRHLVWLSQRCREASLAQSRPAGICRSTGISLRWLLGR
jgi:hypothetical protein